jgi:hypothetical protein
MSDNVAMDLSAHADIIKRIGELSPDDATALLVALLRARPDEAVRAVDACKVARAWREAWRMPIEGGLYAATTHWADDCGDQWWWENARAKTHDGPFGSEAEAQAAADAALVADGWVLASGGAR